MATIIVTGGTLANPLTPTDIANQVGTVIYGNLYHLNSPGTVLQLGDGTTPTFYDDTGWHLLIWYNCKIVVKPFVTWTSGKLQNGKNARGARYMMGYGVDLLMDSSTDITIKWYGVEFGWQSGTESTNSFVMASLNSASHVDMNVNNVFEADASKLVYTTTSVAYSSLNLHNTILRSDVSTTQFDSLIMNGRDSLNEDKAQFYGNTTSLTVDGFAPSSPISQVGSIYGGYTNTVAKNFYLNNPFLNPDTLLFYGSNFTIHINVDMVFNIDVAGCNVGVISGTLPLQEETSTSFRVLDIWTGKHDAQVDAYEVPETVVDSRSTSIKVRKYGLNFNDYSEVVSISGQYEKTLFMSAKSDLTFTEVDALAVTGVVLQTSTDVDYVWELDCGNNSLDSAYHYIQAKLSNFGTLGAIGTFYFNDFLLRDGEKFKTEQIRSGEGIKLINYTGEAVQFAKDDGTYFVLPSFISIAVPNLVSGTRIQVYNITKSVQIDNAIVGANGYNYTTQTGIAFNVEVGDTVRIRVCWQSGTLAKLPISSIGIVSASGVTFLDVQEDDTLHNSLGFDGSTIDLINAPTTGEIQADFSNIQIDVNDPDNVFDCRKGIAWWRYITTTEQGISIYNPLALDYNPDTRNIVIDSNVLQIENIKVETLTVIEGLWVRKDGLSMIAPTSNTIIWIPNDRIYQGLETGISGLTTAESTKLLSLINTDLTATDTKIDNVKLDTEQLIVDVNGLSTDVNIVSVGGTAVTNVNDFKADMSNSGLTIEERNKLFASATKSDVINASQF